MSIRTNSVEVTDAEAVSLADTSGSTGNNPRTISITNNTEDSILYLGGEDVTEETGKPLSYGSTFDIDTGYSNDIYGIASAGDTIDARVFESNL